MTIPGNLGTKKFKKKTSKKQAFTLYVQEIVDHCNNDSHVDI